MSPIDFFLEHCLGMLTWLIFRDVGAYWATSFSIYCYDTDISHSGWDIYLCPGIKNHFIHHNYKVDANLGIFLDRGFGTKMEIWEVEKECKGFFEYE